MTVSASPLCPGNPHSSVTSASMSPAVSNPKLSTGASGASVLSASADGTNTRNAIFVGGILPRPIRWRWIYLERRWRDEDRADRSSQRVASYGAQRSRPRQFARRVEMRISSGRTGQPGICTAVHHEIPLTQGLRGDKNTPLGHTTALNATTPFGRNLLKRPPPQSRVYDFLRFTTALVCFLLPIPFRSAFHVTTALNMNRDGSALTATAHACARHA